MLQAGMRRLWRHHLPGQRQCCRRETTHDVNTRQMMRSFVLTALTPLPHAASHWLQQIATLSHRVDGRLLSIFACFNLPATHTCPPPGCASLRLLRVADAYRLKAKGMRCECMRPHPVPTFGRGRVTLWPVRCKKRRVAGGVCSLQVTVIPGST